MIIEHKSLKPYLIKYDSGSGYTLIKIGIVSDEAVAGKVSVNAGKEKETTIGYYSSLIPLIKKVCLYKAEDEKDVWNLKEYITYLKDTNALLLDCLKDIE